MFEDQTILVTGGTGSWGQELTRRLLHGKPREIRIFSRNEFAQVTMRRMFEKDGGRLKFLVGDVRDPVAVDEACRGADIVFHLAALKHVPICEFQPDEALKTNVQGTENVIRSAIRHGVKKVVDVSTDKAVDPVNFYGMTKAFGEKLMIHADEKGEPTRFVCVRGGNVLGTNGSVVPFFKQRILAGESLPLTSPEMTRFFLTISDAIQLLVKAAEVAVGGEIFVMKMQSCRILDLIGVMYEHLLGDGSPEVEIVGVRPGEKLHEVLVSEHESPHCRRYDRDIFVILPPVPSEKLVKRYGRLPKVPFRRYTSDQSLMTRRELKELLVRGGILT